MDTEPLTLAGLQALIRDALAYPFAWQKFGLGDAKAEAVASFCRDRAAHIAQEVAAAIAALVADRWAERERALNAEHAEHQLVVAAECDRQWAKREAKVQALVAASDAVIAVWDDPGRWHLSREIDALREARDTLRGGQVT